MADEAHGELEDLGGAEGGVAAGALERGGVEEVELEVVEGPGAVGDGGERVADEGLDLGDGHVEAVEPLAAVGRVGRAPHGVPRLPDDPVGVPVVGVGMCVGGIVE